MSENKKPNLIILVVIATLVIFGLFMVTSAGTAISQEKFNQSLYFAKNQIIKGLIPGLALACLFFFLPYHYWRRFASLIFIAGVILMIRVYIPGVGLALGGAKRWIHLGSVNFQPSELFKLGFIIYLSAFLEKRGEKKQGRLIPFLIILGIVGLLIGFQPDLGTLGVFILTAMAISFTSRTPISHMFFMV